jgi:hypothetical protein
MIDDYIYNVFPLIQSNLWEIGMPLNNGKNTKRLSKSQNLKIIIGPLKLP